MKEIYADLSAKNNLEWMQYIERKRQHQAREDRRSDIVRMLLETNKGAAGMFIREQDAAGMFAAAPRRPLFPFESLTEQFLAPWLRRARAGARLDEVAGDGRGLGGRPREHRARHQQVAEPDLRLCVPSLRREPQ